MANHSTNMSISLPAGLKDSIQEVVRRDYYGTPSDYIRSVIRDDLRRRDKEKLEQMLLDGLNSGKGSEMTKKEWARLKKEAHARLKKKALRLKT